MFPPPPIEVISRQEVNSFHGGLATPQVLYFLHRQGFANCFWKKGLCISECRLLAYGSNLQRAKEAGRRIMGLSYRSVPDAVNHQSEETLTGHFLSLDSSYHRKGFGIACLNLDGLESES